MRKTGAYTPPEAKRRLRKAISDGVVFFTRHAREEMVEDGIDMVDIFHVLRAGTVDPVEEEGGAYRYRVHAGEVWVVVEFAKEENTLVITAWRRKR